MLLSMTGYGSAECDLGNKTLKIELKALNSKHLDLIFKIPSRYREKEPALRKEIGQEVVRGKVEMVFSLQDTSGETSQQLNAELIRSYFENFKSITKQLGVEISDPSLFSQAMRMPDVMHSSRNSFEPAEWKETVQCLKSAIAELTKYRAEEGMELQAEFELRIKNIMQGLKVVGELDPKRIERKRAKIQDQLNEWANPDNIDDNRLEQEIIYYLEKQDITEERVRLTTNCDHFLKELNAKGSVKGKKLGFISQEIGREINTIGSKASDSDMQREVVVMKDELEKIKEQLHNIL